MYIVISKVRISSTFVAFHEDDLCIFNRLSEQFSLDKASTSDLMIGNHKRPTTSSTKPLFLEHHSPFAYPVLFAKQKLLSTHPLLAEDLRARLAQLFVCSQTADAVTLEPFTLLDMMIMLPDLILTPCRNRVCNTQAAAPGQQGCRMPCSDSCAEL